jgi:hypothetical protein
MSGAVALPGCNERCILRASLPDVLARYRWSVFKQDGFEYASHRSTENREDRARAFHGARPQGMQSHSAALRRRCRSRSSRGASALANHRRRIIQRRSGQNSARPQNWFSRAVQESRQFARHPNHAGVDSETRSGRRSAEASLARNSGAGRGGRKIGSGDGARRI